MTLLAVVAALLLPFSSGSVSAAPPSNGWTETFANFNKWKVASESPASPFNEMSIQTFGGNTVAKISISSGSPGWALTRLDLANGGQFETAYWIAAAFYIEDWAQLWDDGHLYQQGPLMSMSSDPNEQMGWMTNGLIFQADSATAGRISTGVWWPGTPWVNVTAGQWHTFRQRLVFHANGTKEVTFFLDGAKVAETTDQPSGGPPVEWWGVGFQSDLGQIQGTDNWYVDNLTWAIGTDPGEPAIPPAGPPPPPPPPPPPSPPPSPALLDDFNRGNETPLSQSGNWAASGIGAGSAARLTQSRLTNYAQPAYSYRVREYLGGELEASMRVAAKPGSTNWLSIFICLQQAATAGWDGYELRVSSVNGGPDQWQIFRVDNGTRTSLASTNLEIAVDGTAVLRRKNGKLEVWWRTPAGSWQQLLVNELALYDQTYQYGSIGAGGYKSGALDDFGGGSLLSLLQEYTPELRHSAFDTYRAGSPAMLTDNVNDAQVPNQLAAADVTVLAQADWALPTDDLSLTPYLNANYPQGGVAQGRAALADDYLDAVDASRIADAQRMQADTATYGNKVYAREVPGSGGTKTLQYWLFYYYNWHPTTVGEHEGDWEMVQYEVDSKGMPIRAAYSQHGGGETCNWSAVQRSPLTGRPIAFPARGSHASYFRSGFKPPSPVAVGGDEADGNAPPVVPVVVDIGSSSPGWLNWPGRWGDRVSGSFASPAGPAQPSQGWKWPSPAFWADTLSSCWEVSSFRRSSSDEAASLPPPAPKIAATREGRRVRITYSFNVWPAAAARRPVVLLTSVQSSGTRYAPYMKRHRISARRGVVYQPLGLGKAPFKLYAASYSRSGMSSRTITVRVRGG